MDSLLATYASSDEEEEEHEAKQQNTVSKSKVSSLFTALPQPKSSSSLFSSLPQPKLSLTLTNPKTQQNQQQQPVSNSNQSNPKKRVVEFKPHINFSTIKPTDFDEDDEDEEEKEQKERKMAKESESLTVKSFLSTIPAPKNSSTLGVLPSSSGSGRRSIIETQTQTEAPVSTSSTGNTQNVEEDYVNYDTNYPNYDTNYPNYESGVDNSYVSYENYGSYGNYVDYVAQYGNNSGDGSVSIVPQTAAVSDSVMRVPGKRRRNDVPIDIVEVKQDELIKDRPREDQAKLTGIAFGPSYQPVSTKGKPSKLHKRKHQIGTLYFDMKQKEMELSERRAKGFLTKAETQAKYGW